MTAAVIKNHLSSWNMRTQWAIPTETLMIIGIRSGSIIQRCRAVIFGILLTRDYLKKQIKEIAFGLMAVIMEWTCRAMQISIATAFWHRIGHFIRRCWK